MSDKKPPSAKALGLLAGCLVAGFALFCTGIYGLIGWAAGSALIGGIVTLVALIGLGVAADD